MMLQTKLTHLGRHSKFNGGSVNDPLFQTSTVLFPDYASFLEGEKHYDDYCASFEKEVPYGRVANQTNMSLEELIKDLEGADYTKITSCGMSAITTAVLSCVKAGDHVLVSDGTYGPARRFFLYYLTRFGVEVSFYDPTITYESLKLLFKTNTKAIYCENPSSMSFDVQDLPAIVRAAKEFEAKIIVDSTWATPLFYNPLKFGADIVVSSLTKYASGHGDVLLGCVSCKKDHVTEIAKIANLLGNHASAHSCYMVLRGLRTLSARLQAQSDGLFHTLDFLSKHPMVHKVLHPSHPDCDGHEVFKRDFKGSANLFSVVLNKSCTYSQLEKAINGLQLFGVGYSWGGYESLIIPFSLSSKARITGHWKYEGAQCFRIYIGLEAPEDIIKDLKAMLERLW